MSYEELPEFLTIPEAARLLRISRGAAYAAARQLRSYRVPKAALVRFQDAEEIRRLLSA